MGSRRKARRQPRVTFDRRTLILFGCLIALGLGSILFQFWNVLVPSTSSELRPLADIGNLPATMNTSWNEIDNPAKDGWDSEVVSATTDKVLKKFGEMLIDPARLSASALNEYVSPQFRGDELVPTQRKTVFQDGVIQVERAVSLNNAGSHHGVQGLVEAFRSLHALVSGARDIHHKFKLFRISPGTNGAYTTIQYVALSGHLPKGMVEQNATWEMRWKMDATSNHPVLQGITLKEFEVARSTVDQGGIFSDCTMSVMGNVPMFREQFHRGMNHWLERIQDRRYYYILSQPGIAVGDVNGDGLDDIYVCQEKGCPTVCFFNRQMEASNQSQKNGAWTGFTVLAVPCCLTWIMMANRILS